MDIFNAFLKNLQEHYTVDVKYKNESRLMRLIGFLMFFNKDFMTMYVTTIGNTVYLPSEQWLQKNETAAIEMLAHETVHTVQAEKVGKSLFNFLYLFPQVLGVLGVFGILGLIWTPAWFLLLFFLFLAPIPAFFRRKYELEAYTMSLFIAYMRRQHKGVEQTEIDTILSEYVNFFEFQFTSAPYYFMWPFGVRKILEQKMEMIRAGVISDTDEMYGRVYRAYIDAVSTYEL